MKRGVLAAALALAACARPEPIGPVVPLSRAPDVRVAIAVGEGSLSLGGGEGLALANGESGLIGEVPPGEAAQVDIFDGALRVRAAGRATALGQNVVVTALRSGGQVRLNGRDYRGIFLLLHARGRVSAVNVVDLEDYLVGVVGAELGPRSEGEFAALEAQAIVSRTVALQRVGQWRSRGYDLLATVSDQVYAGTTAESELAARAVAATRGQVLTYGGRVIDAFFHSTCAGRTATGTEVFAAAGRPYLRSVPDLDSEGRAWCAISPRYRWRESWSGELIARTLRETLPLAGGSPELATELRDLQVLERTASGRVARFMVRGARDTLIVTGPAARAVLRTAEGSVLRSADFTIQISRSGERIVHVAAEGAGAGHGVGLCQWGAIGRARAGIPYHAILSAYFPGTELTRTY